MKRFISTFIVLSGVSAFGVVPALAETADKTVTAAKVLVSISYQINMPIAENATPEQDSLAQRGRRIIYQRARRECVDLLEILASSCRLKTLNVSGRHRYNRRQPGVVIISGSARYEVVLK